MKIDKIEAVNKDLVLEEYFSGKTKAYGLFFDFRHRVKANFVVDIEGSWDGKVLTMDEDFIYDDGRTEVRQWKIEKTADDTYEGWAEGVVGKAKGLVTGAMLRWAYTFDLQTRKRVIRLKFDDRMYLQPEGTLLNIARVKKFGITVGTLFLAFRKV